MSASIEPAQLGPRKPSDFAGGITALAEGKLYALQNPFPLDGRVSAYPGSARGFSVANSYLLREGDAALLVAPSFGMDEPTIRLQLDTLRRNWITLMLFP